MAEKEKTIDPTDTVKVVANWMRIIEDCDFQINSVDINLIYHLARDILARWRYRAEEMDGGVELFNDMYEKYKHNAIGFIVAVLEGVGRLGKSGSALCRRSA